MVYDAADDIEAIRSVDHFVQDISYEAQKGLQDSHSYGTSQREPHRGLSQSDSSPSGVPVGNAAVLGALHE
eukprot:3324358-Amphidinium_carterae.1